jgi:hypothetical protein
LGFGDEEAEEVFEVASSAGVARPRIDEGVREVMNDFEALRSGGACKHRNREAVDAIAV